ncbi:MAG: A/G-specific adenine glycosylase [Deltaproteobacteria bacterium]|nr:A/G-specific adenine glycosylase [Deltaproteobacteria bacterium]
MPANNFAPLRRKLLRWYDAQRRDLPWRRTRDPYAIWISETMLQQTQVATVIPYYERFMKAFPTPALLAQAPLKKVLTLWSGLGYYRRAENLQRAAETIAREHGGELPNRYDALRALPGVGDYTAGALMSIAFDQRYPAVDGNVRRVLSRLFALTDEKTLRSQAATLVPHHHPGDFNQALMELGATVCAPSAPSCAACPFEQCCASRRNPSAVSIPGTKKHLHQTRVAWPLAIVWRNGKILLRRRPKDRLLAGMWELPGGELKKRETLQQALGAELRTIDCHNATPRKIGTLRHAITHRNIHAPVFLVTLADHKEIRLPSSNWRWVAPASLHRYPTSSMTAKALKIFTAHEKASL